jgi:CheY-like chemotaxis protein
MKTKIQVIDDNALLTTLLSRTLAKLGYEPVVENNLLLAINTARHHLPDLILLDLMMSGACSRIFCFAISLSFSSLRLLAKCKAWLTQEASTS